MNTKVHNRWGDEVFETSNKQIEWDGKNCNDGTYFWIVTYTDVYGNRNFIKGFLTIIK